MFGLTFEKLLLIALLAAFIIGPTRLPDVARSVGRFVRGVRSLVDTAKAHAEREVGPLRSDWESLDLRQYDPRRIVRDALDERPDAGGVPVTEVAEPAAEPVDAPEPEPQLEPAPIATRWQVSGSSGHPQRVRVPVDGG